nr:unnamed protein product [Digitaria exilis]
MAHLLGASSLKKRRAGEEGEEIEAAAAMAAEEEDRISELPEDLRLRILTLLPLRSAIRTGALSTRWRALWERRWPAPSSMDLHIRPGDDPEELLRSLERRGERRIDRFSLTIHPNKRPLQHHRVRDPQRFLDYAAACAVEDLHIDAAGHFVSMLSTFIFPPGCSHLARVFIRHTGRVSFRSFPCSDASRFPALEVIHLYLVRSVDINELLWACPRLQTLDLRYCDVLGFQGVINLESSGAHLRSLTVAECNRITRLDASRATGLRSFCLSSAQLPTYNIPATASLDDLYLSLRGQNCEPIKHWIQALPNLANLTVLTICSVALRLVMLEMDIANLAHMFVFLRCCWCPQLMRLFVQLPSSSHDIFVDNSLEEAEEDEPNEVLFKMKSYLRTMLQTKREMSQMKSYLMDMRPRKNYY